MDFVSRLVVGVLIGVFFFMQEILLRNAAGLKPGKFKEVTLYLDRKLTPSQEWRALSLPLVSFFFFSVWEYLVLFMFARRFYAASFILGAASLLYLIYRRSKALKSAEPKFAWLDLAIGCVGWLLLFESIFSLPLLLWIAWRARFLRKTQLIS
jgi:hypothetical protein